MTFLKVTPWYLKTDLGPHVMLSGKVARSLDLALTGTGLLCMARWKVPFPLLSLPQVVVIPALKPNRSLHSHTAMQTSTHPHEAHLCALCFPTQSPSQPLARQAHLPSLWTPHARALSKRLGSPSQACFPMLLCLCTWRSLPGTYSILNLAHLPGSSPL